jgi:hypothetical protein
MSNKKKREVRVYKLRLLKEPINTVKETEYTKL